MRSRREVMIEGVFLWWVVLAIGGSLAGSSAVFVSAPLARQEVAAAAQSDVPELVVGTPLERELKGGQTHAYRLALAAHQYLRLVVEQQGIDVVVRLFGPDGRQLVEVDSPTGTQGAETVLFVAETAGTYRVEVAPLEKEAAPGRYSVRIEELRPAIETDRTRVAAERAYAEAERLRAQQTADSLRQAVAKYEEASRLYHAVGEREKEVVCLVWVGVLSSQLGDVRKGLEYFSQALPIFRAVGDRAREATTLNNIGLVYSALGERQKALEYFDQALPIFRAVGNRAGEAATLNNIGGVYAALGENQKALEYFDQALPIFRAVGDRAGEATTLNNIGGVYFDLGEKQKALEYFGQALALCRAVGNRAGEAVALTSIGGVYAALGERQKALEYYGQALALHRAVGNRAGEAITLNNIGLVYAALGERQKALEYLGQALPLHRAVGNRAGEATTLTNIGGVYSDLGERQKALEYFGQALPIFRAVGFREGEAVVLGHIAWIERDRGDLGEARARIEAALGLIETVRAQAPGPELRATFLASKRDYYEFYIDLLLRLHERDPDKGHDRVAFEASERGRARSLLELLTEARVDVRQGIAPELKERERAVHARLAAIQSQLRRAFASSPPDAARIAALEAEFKRADAEREQVELEIRRKHPRYAELQYPTPLGVSAVQGVLDDASALLEYILTRESAFVFVLTREEFRVVRLGSPKTIREQVEKLREAVARGPLRGAFSNYVLYARWLYQELVEPVEKLIAGKRELIIVPDGILYYLPFELLLTSGEGMGGRSAPLAVSGAEVCRLVCAVGQCLGGAGAA